MSRLLKGIFLTMAVAGQLTCLDAQEADTLESGHDRGYPWIAHSSAEAFYLASPVGEGASQPYQISLYQGFTIQSLSFASFHMGLRTRETYAPGFSGPYREPMAIKLASTAEIFRDFLFVSLGGTFPTYAGTIDPGDSLAFYRSLNEYNPMPHSAFLSPQAVELAVFGRYTFGPWTTLGAISYNRPARLNGIVGYPFFPAAYFNFSARAIWETSSARHRFEGKSTLYGAESNSQRIESHDEGDLWQFRYGYLKSYTKVAWQGGLGLSVKLPDANRKLKLKSALETTLENDNIQRTYGEISLAWAPSRRMLWRFQLLPKMLFTQSGAKFGHETEAGVGLGLKLWEIHRLRASGSFLYGNFAGKQYTGFGIRSEFTFRHLGFQDLEDQVVSGEGDP